MSKLEFEVTHNGNVVLKLDGSFENGCIEEVLSDIAPIIQAALEARRSVLDMGDDVPLNRIRAASALELKAGIGLHYVTCTYNSVADLMAGRAAAEELGFPEFSDLVDGGSPV